MIRAYFKSQRKVLLSILFASVTFSILMFLLNNNPSDILYGVLLYLIVMIGYLLVDSYRFFKRYQELLQLVEDTSLGDKQLPDTKEPMEQLYTQIIQKQIEVIRDALSQMDKQAKENEEYYTLWIHQIKTPISAMYFVLENMEDIPQKVVLELELFKVEQYIELALQFIKIKNLEADLVINTYPLKDMINQSVRKYSTLFIQKGLGVNVSDCDKIVTTDSKWFCFILEQILSNAIKYTTNGSIHIYALEEEKKTILTIEDSGIGIKKEDIKRVFEKGYTGFNGRMDKKASGIGLYLVKKVSIALNHQITIESDVSKGTKVHILLKHYT